MSISPADPMSTIYSVYRKEPGVTDPSDPTPADLKEGGPSYRPTYENRNGACYQWSTGPDGELFPERVWNLYEDPFMGDENKIPRNFYSSYGLFIDTDPFNIKDKNGHNKAFETKISIQEKEYYPISKSLANINASLNDYDNFLTSITKKFEYRKRKVSNELGLTINSPVDLGRLKITIDKNHLNKGLRLTIPGWGAILNHQEKPIQECTPLLPAKPNPAWLIRKVYVVANIDPVYYELINLKWKWLNNNIKNPKLKLANWPEAKFLAVRSSRFLGGMGVLPDNSYTYAVLPLFQENLKNITAERIEYQDLSKHPFTNGFTLLIHPIEILRETRAISSLTVYIYQEVVHNITAAELGLKDGLTRKYYYNDSTEITDNLETNTYNFISGPGKFQGFPHDQEIFNKYVSGV
jgi:hypothetical protein